MCRCRPGLDHRIYRGSLGRFSRRRFSCMPGGDRYQTRACSSFLCGADVEGRDRLAGWRCTPGQDVPNRCSLCVAPAISRRGLDIGRFSAVPVATRLSSCENAKACLTRHANVRNRISLWQIGPGRSRKFSDAACGLRRRAGWLQASWADGGSAVGSRHVKVGWSDGCENQSVGR